MEFKKLNAPSLKELFVNELQNMILSGKLEIGSKLPPERELAESMKVSRAVINSGIAELEKKGFLVVRPRIGTFVADYHRDGSLDTLVAIMNYNGGVLKNREVKSVLEARIMFMVEASQFAPTLFCLVPRSCMQPLGSLRTKIRHQRIILQCKKNL